MGVGRLLTAMAILGLSGGERPGIVGSVASQDGRPVAGAEVVLTAGPAPDGSVPILSRTRSDGDGRFVLERPERSRMREFFSPGVIWVHRPGLGLGLVDLGRADRPGQAHRLILEPQEVRRVTIGDGDGRPVVGARVSARLLEAEATNFLGVNIPDDWLDRLAATTDARGVAELPGLTHRIELRSVRVDAAGRSPHVAPLRYEDGKIEARIAIGRSARLEGTVRDDAGEPVVGASVEIWTRCAAPLGAETSWYTLPERVAMAGRPVETDARGAFRSSGMTAGGTYRVVVRTPGHATALSDWITLKGETSALPPVTIRRLRTIVGRIVDRQGRPIAGARVLTPSGGPSTMTDADGRFRLSGVRPGHPFVMARRDGYRFGGMRLDGPEGRPIEVVLARPAEPPGRWMTTLPGPIPEEESRSLARRVIGPYRNRALADGDDAAKLWSLREFRWLDPAGLFEQVQKTRFERESTADFLRGEAALGLAAADPDEAAAIAETIADPAARAGTLVDLADLTPAGDRARKVALLDRAAIQARAGKISSDTLFQIGEVAERWLELGEARKARELFDEGRRLVEAEPPAARTNAGSFLAHLSRVEPDLPLKLIEDVGTVRWRERTLGNIAIRLAFEHPAEAETLLNRIEEPTWRIFGAPRICRRLAAKDRARARRIAGHLPHPAERAYAWTFLAEGLAGIDRTAAQDALDRALLEIDSIDAGDRTHPFGPNPAASILPIVERVAAERVGEVFWRAVAMAAPGDDPRVDFAIREGVLASEVALLSRYDRDVARILFEPIAAFVRSRPLRDANDIIPAVVVALGCLDPRAADEMVESLPPAGSAGVDAPTNWARVTLAEVLAKPPDRRWMGVWRFYSGCGIAMFEDVYRGL